jgi:hypothetical protein
VRRWWNARPVPTAALLTALVIAVGLHVGTVWPDVFRATPPPPGPEAPPAGEQASPAPSAHRDPEAGTDVRRAGPGHGPCAVATIAAPPEERPTWMEALRCLPDG